MSNIIYLSREKLLEMEKELNDLKTNGRKHIAGRIAEARAHGDLSENAEYDAAKDEQGLLELKINKMEDQLSRAMVIDRNALPKDQVHIFSKVTVKNLKTLKESTYTIVSPEEADLEQKKISITSPIGNALVGRKSGEVFEAKVPAGVIKFEILKLE
ncbi:MAG: transcription elongation factor GreA [Ignavibacteriales bacterium]|nr:transcription elongation factor GreA [Ignavibacteriales bacterium]MCF8437475.1 transcription elongation factor GreA [Ignavibacteriales bacterium]